MQQRYVYVLMSFGVLLVGSVFLVWSTKIQPTPNKNTWTAEETSEKEFQPTLAKQRDHVLSRAKITGVTDEEGPYKRVTISNPATIFFFEVPDTWLTETRNSGEIRMNQEELREFFATSYFGDLRDDPSGLAGSYWDFTWNMLKDMSFNEMKAAFEKHKFPNASVSGGNYIGYLGGNQYQVDLYVFQAQDSKKYFDYDASQESFAGGNLTPISVGGLKAKESITPPGVYGAGSAWIFVPLPDTHSILVLNKQGYSDDFDTGFGNLLKSFRFIEPDTRTP